MQILYYRTRDGQADYCFAFLRAADGSYHAVILDMPSYGARDTSLAITHRLPTGDGRYKVCWDRPLWSEEEAKAVAAKWADLTQTYLQTGVTIDQQVREGA